jgi:hypothetical protein
VSSEARRNSRNRNISAEQRCTVEHRQAAEAPAERKQAVGKQALGSEP